MIELLDQVIHLPRPVTMVTRLRLDADPRVLASVLDAAVSMVLRKPAYKVITAGGKWTKTLAARRMSRLLR